MSRSNNTEYPNPASRFYQWNGQKGGFRFWDKEKEQNVETPLPFRFVVLDCLSTIKGFSDDNQSGFWSNEVRDIKRDILTVRTKAGIAAKGLYHEVIASPFCKGAKFCQSVYVMIHDGEKSIITNLQLTGAALSAWIEFRKKNKIYEGAVDVSEMIEGKKGAVTYQMPVFKLVDISPAVNQIAMSLDKQVQDYLAAYFKRTQEETAVSHSSEIVQASPSEDYDQVSDGDYIPLSSDTDLPF